LQISAYYQKILRVEAYFTENIFGLKLTVGIQKKSIDTISDA
jgi:hypothetical protein